MPARLAVLLIVCRFLVSGQFSLETQSSALRSLVAASPRLPLRPAAIPLQPPQRGWGLGMVSWVATSGGDRIYLLQRGKEAPPVVVIDQQGKVLHSWGAGMYTMPHSIRLDRDGNVWTTDAATSTVVKFTAEGRKLLEIRVGGQPDPCPNNFCGTTDVAFAPDGNILIADGYKNARIVEYSAEGRKVREWGAPGVGPGQFRLPHSIQIDDRGVIYVADRENGRIQRFDRGGRYLGEWSHLGKTFSLTLRRGLLYISTQPRNVPNFSPGWLMKIDPADGRILGYVENTGNHGVAVNDAGELLIAPGPNGPQWFRALP